MKTMNIILMGGPGSGKGSMAERILEKYPLVHIATGDLLRKNASQGTELGKQAKAYMDQGALVPNEITYQILEAGMADVGADQGILLDGFPRNMEQAEKLDEIFERIGRDISLVIQVDLDDDTIVERTGKRRVCTECGASYHLEFKAPKVEGICDRCGGTVVQRDDDKPEAVNVRLKTYYRETQPVTDLYADRGLLKHLDNSGSMEDSRAKLEDILEAYQAEA